MVISNTGFHDEAFEEFVSKKDDPMFRDCTLLLDEMSIKSLIQYDPLSGKNFGFVDYGGHSTSGDYDAIATDALVCMLHAGWTERELEDPHWVLFD